MTRIQMLVGLTVIAVAAVTIIAGITWPMFRTGATVRVVERSPDSQSNADRDRVIEAARQAMIKEGAKSFERVTFLEPERHEDGSWSIQIVSKSGIVGGHLVIVFDKDLNVIQYIRGM